MSENAEIEIVHPDPEIAEQVRQLARTKSREQVSRKLALPMATLEAFYEDDFVEGEDEADGQLMEKLLAQGLAGNANAAWKWMGRKNKLLAGRFELTGRGGGPIETIDLSRLTPKQLEDYGRLAAIAEGLDPDSILIVEQPDR